MTLSNQTPGVITLWSDLSCPWATLALHTLHEAAAKRGVKVYVDHRAFPLELLNREPTPKPGHDEEVEAILSVRPDVGWSTWRAPDSTFPVTTLPAMEAVQAAKGQGLEAGDELDSALRRAFFVEQRCISLHPVIEDVARSCAGVDADALMAALARGDGRAQVYADLDATRSGEIKGSPHFWTANGPFAANPGVDDTEHFTSYDASWLDQLL
jgi:predicted DsbA family dithiol-disulfide isomerase